MTTPDRRGIRGYVSGLSGADRVTAGICLSVLLIAALALGLSIGSDIGPSEYESSLLIMDRVLSADLPGETLTMLSSKKYSADEMTGRVAFLRIARGQLGSRGEIIGGEDGEYYSRWYVGGEYTNGWSEDTPWCGVFVSWAASQDGVKEYLRDFKAFASVEKGMELFTDGTNGAWLDEGEKPLPGDLIFFDWEEEGDDDHGKPDHVGIVTRVDKEAGTIITIEGNCDGEVKEQTYAPDDPRIMGFGVLEWK